MKLKKSRGQHLLTDKNMLDKIIRESSVNMEDSVLEIGAGTGLLTELLVKNAGKVVSFEIDRDFEPNLRELEKSYKNLTIEMVDFLKYDLKGFFRKNNAHLNSSSPDKNANCNKWKVVANIPYYITTPIIEKLIEDGKGCISDIYLLIQKEVAQRIVAKPGGKDYGRLTVYAQFFFDCKILFTVPPDVFVPPPTVDSAFIQMKPKDSVLDVNPPVFFGVVQAAFAQRRKQIRNAVKNSLPGLSQENIDKVFEISGIDKTRRGETLSLVEFARLSKTVDEMSKSTGIALKRETEGE
jgi:16S rRNA (adenine1518-N6/adenine1519-N6)-dimethyltransferase